MKAEYKKELYEWIENIAVLIIAFVMGYFLSKYI